MTDPKSEMEILVKAAEAALAACEKHGEQHQMDFEIRYDLGLEYLSFNSHGGYYTNHSWDSSSVC